MRECMRVLVVDDMPLACERVSVYLREHADTQVVGECSSGRDAVSAIQRLRPDLVFLDVHMPDMNGFQVLDAVPSARQPLVIFLTAYQEHAVQAFEVSALDYLVKPVDRVRFDQALNRARMVFTQGSTAGQGPAADGYLSRLPIRDGNRTELVPVRDIDYIDIAGHYLCVHAGERVHLLRGALRELEQQLDPACFARAHRSHIVRLDRIRCLKPRRNGDFSLELENGTAMTLSRSYSRDLLQRLDLVSAGS